MISDEDFMLKYMLMSIAKDHNFFGQVEGIMREFGRVLIEQRNRGCGPLAKAFEEALNSPFIVLDRELASKLLLEREGLTASIPSSEKVAHGSIIAREDFVYAPTVEKLRQLKEFDEIKITMQRLEEAIDLL